MASINVPSKTSARTSSTTHEGTPAHILSAGQELERAASTYLLWEDQHYESGESIAARIAGLVPKLPGAVVAAIAIRCRQDWKLRHTPMFLIRELARHPDKEARRHVADAIVACEPRPDDLCELVALYWKDKKQPLSAQLKKGINAMLGKYNEYQLAKYNQDGAVRLRDLVFLTHPKPTPAIQKLIENTLPSPETWENRLSRGENKKATFTAMLNNKELGALATLRNLRNMIEAGVDEALIKSYLVSMPTDRVLPFQFITAARYAPRLEGEIETAMLKCLEGVDKLPGKTALIVDTSPSMWMQKVSSRSEMDRFEAAAALAILLREICEHVRIYTFNHTCHDIPANRHGFALRDVMAKTKGDYSKGGLAVKAANDAGYDRIIVLTDGQWHFSSEAEYNEYQRQESNSRRFNRLYSSTRGWQGSMDDAKFVSPAPLTDKSYMINVASDKNGVGYGKWTMIDGWSEAIVRYIHAFESIKG